MVDDRILGCGPLRPRGVAAQWTVNAKLGTCRPRSKQTTKNQATASARSVAAPIGVSTLLDGSEDAVAVASTVVTAAKASVATSPPVRGADSLLRTTLRYALKGTPSL
jgi:hypothetical protein